jgi:hypothetical protein
MRHMDRVKAIMAATESDTPFRHATNMEDPLTSIGVLVSALCLISETMEEPFGLVVQELARNIGESVQKLDKEHSYFFDLHHPCPPLEDSPNGGSETAEPTQCSIIFSARRFQRRRVFLCEANKSCL